jgi:hypothetical protein
VAAGGENGNVRLTGAPEFDARLCAERAFAIPAVKVAKRGVGSTRDCAHGRPVVRLRADIASMSSPLRVGTAIRRDPAGDNRPSHTSFASAFGNFRFCDLA